MLAAWAIGALAAGIVHFNARQYVEVFAGIAAAAFFYAVLHKLASGADEQPRRQAGSLSV